MAENETESVEEIEKGSDAEGEQESEQESDVCEPKSKRRREDQDEDSIIRKLELNLAKYPEWVRSLSSNDLVKIFDIGIAVRESITMNIIGGEEQFNEVVSKVENTKTELERTIDSKVDEIITPLEECIKKFEELANKPALKGAVGEIVVLSELKNNLPHHSFKDVTKQKGGGCGDIHVSSPVSEYKYLIEVKTWESTLSAPQIQKFEENVSENPEFKVGILLSLDSGIARRAVNRKFEITFSDEQYFIYVPNARKEVNLIVWSVLLADELASLDGGITECQIQELQKIQKKFKDNVEKSKKCRSRFQSLQQLVKDFEDDLMPLLEIIDGVKMDLNKALHQRTKVSSTKRIKRVVPQTQPIDRFFGDKSLEN